jgi:hypothetical protein
MARSHWIEWLADALRCEEAARTAPTPEAKIHANAQKVALLFDAMTPLIDAGAQAADNDIHRRRWMQMKRMIAEARGLNDGVIKDTDPE